MKTNAHHIILLGCLLGMLASQEAAAQNAQPGRIVGHIDGISQDADHYFLLGWACQQGQSKSIAVQLFAEKAANGLSKQGPLFAETANLFSEPGVAQACRDSGGGKHRFIVVLPYGYGPESNLSIHGIRAVDGVPNDLIAGSGTKLALKPLAAPYSALPPLGGSYRSLTQHPGVFMTGDELKDMASRINRPGSYSMRRFDLLAKQIAMDLKSGIDWDVTYSGPDAVVYEYVFSYEPQDQHDAETRAALKIPASVKAPAGAAVVASRLSLYAALLKAGAAAPPGAPGANESIAVAKRILLAWADRGFRDTDGHFQALGSFTRDGHGRPASQLGLTLGRGVIYSVHAEDLLEGMGALNPDEIRRLNAFHEAIFDLIRLSENVLYAGVGFPYSDCSRYTNLAMNANVGMLATARLLNDERKVKAVLFGGAAVPVLAPWTHLFDHLIYGRADGPAPGCVSNHEPDSQSSLANHHDYQTTNAAPGEIADRFRNAKSGQGIGYPMFTLERLFDAAELMRIAGFDPYNYRGEHHQSIEMAMEYYACYAKGAGFYKTVTAENSGSCPNAAQYYGKLVNGVDGMLLIGAERFSGNAAITRLEAGAQATASTGAFSTDAILFGKWRD